MLSYRQTLLLALFALPQSLWLFLLAISPDYALLLINDSRGRRLALVGLGSQVFGAVLYVLFCRTINTQNELDDDRRFRVSQLLYYLVGASIFVFFALPAVFVALVGPAAIQITNNLQAME